MKFLEHYRLFMENAIQKDSDYMNAVENHDLDTCQQMVRGAASASGYVFGPVYHGTKAENIQEFRQKDSGIWLAHEEKNASPGSGEDVRKVLKLYVDPGDNVYQLTELEYKEWQRSSRPLVIIKKIFWRERPTAIRVGEYALVVFRASQLKSADPITYVKGRPVPLSKRFDHGSKNINESSDKLFVERFDNPYKFHHRFSEEEIEVEDEETGETYTKSVLSPVQIIEFEGEKGMKYVWYARQSRYDETNWEITFGVEKSRGLNGSYQLDIGLTNGGEVYRVFATVLEILHAFLEWGEEDGAIQSLWMSVEGEKRKRVYMNQLLPRIDGFDVSGVYPDGDDKWRIEMTKKG